MTVVRTLCFLFGHCLCIMALLDDGRPFYHKPYMYGQTPQLLKYQPKERVSSESRGRYPWNQRKHTPQRPIGFHYEKLGSHVLQNVGNTATTINIEFGKSPQEEITAIDRLVSSPTDDFSAQETAKSGRLQAQIQPFKNAFIGDSTNSVDEPRSSKFPAEPNYHRKNYRRREKKLRILDAMMKRHINDMLQTPDEGLDKATGKIQENEGTTSDTADPVVRGEKSPPDFKFVKEMLYEGGVDENQELEDATEVEVGKMLSNDPQLSSLGHEDVFQPGEAYRKNDIQVVLALDSTSEVPKSINSKILTGNIQNENDETPNREKRSAPWYQPVKPPVYKQTTPYSSHSYQAESNADWRSNDWKHRQGNWKKSNNNLMESYDDWKKMGTDWAATNPKQERNWMNSNGWSKADYDWTPSRGHWRTTAVDWINPTKSWKRGGTRRRPKCGHWKSGNIYKHSKSLSSPTGFGKPRFLKFDTRMHGIDQTLNKWQKPFLQEKHDNRRFGHRFDKYNIRSNKYDRKNNWGHNNLFKPFQTNMRQITVNQEHQPMASWSVPNHFNYHKTEGFTSPKYNRAIQYGYQPRDLHIFENVGLWGVNGNDITPKEAPAMPRHTNNKHHHSRAGVYDPYWNTGDGSHQRRHEHSSNYPGSQQTTPYNPRRPSVPYQQETPDYFQKRDNKIYHRENKKHYVPPQPIDHNDLHAYYSHW